LVDMRDLNLLHVNDRNDILDRLLLQTDSAAVVVAVAVLDLMIVSDWIYAVAERVIQFWQQIRERQSNLLASTYRAF
jgi:hypothetical protein